MRIQTRIFLVLSLLVMAVVAVQVWLNYRQMQAVELSLGTVATSVGRDVLAREFEVIDRLRLAPPSDSDDGEKSPSGSRVTHEVFVNVVGDNEEIPAKTLRKVVEWKGVGREFDPPLKADEAGGLVAVDGSDGAPNAVFVQADARIGGDAKVQTRVIHLEVDDERPRMMMVFEDEGDVTEIEIPTLPTMNIFRTTLRTSLVSAAVLLVVGLGASAVVSRRLAKPLQDLAKRAEELGSGEVGLRVPVTTSGEVGELEASFDRMSVRLGQLEREREEWRRREHLAQLGDLSRGLAHTVRNPLHTLGLAVEELAGEGEDPRVNTARSEIRRIDRWIRSFLALGAGDAAAPQQCDLVELVQEGLLEAGHQGVEIKLQAPAGAVPVEVIPTGFRAALGNLLENAIQASDEGGAVDVVVSSAGGRARIDIRDQGPGIPDGVRQRLFEPHQTTRPGGSGMGLFLARQLIEEMHGGSLTLSDADGGGTLVSIEIPIAEA